MNETTAEKLERFNAALQLFLERVSEDRYVQAVVLVGSLAEETIWRRDAIHLWIIEADGVSRRLRSDGNDERIHRLLVEDGVNIHAELIPRSRFKQMVEGASRTAFSCNFFATRKMVFTRDSAIEDWFEQANTVATKDKERELLAFTTWTLYAQRLATRRLERNEEVSLVFQDVLSAAHSVAYTEIIRHGEIWEREAISKAIDYEPELFQAIYLDVLAKSKNRKVLATALDRIDEYLEVHYVEHLKPLLSYLKKANRMLALSEIGDHFAFSQIYPWHIEAACEWLERKGRLEKFSAPFKLTKRSQEQVEEPAYLLDANQSSL